MATHGLEDDPFIGDSKCMLCNRDLNLPQSDAELDSNSCWYCGERTQLIRLCPNQERGCKWIGHQHDLIQHSKECEFANVECAKCNWRGERRELPVHERKECPRRPYPCNFCRAIVPYEEVRTRHWPNCKEYPEPMKEKDREVDAALGTLHKLEEAHNKQGQQIDELQKRLRQQDCDMQKKLANVEETLKQQIASNKEQVDKQIDELQKRLRQQDCDMQTKLANVEETLKQQIAINKEQIDELQKSLRRQLDDKLANIEKITEGQIERVLEQVDQQIDKLQKRLTQLDDDLQQKLVNMKAQTDKALQQKIQKGLRELEDYVRSEKIQPRSLPYSYTKSPAYKEYTPLLANQWETRVADEVLTAHK